MALSTTLTSQQRGLLSRAVTAARREAEAGAHEALQALGVDHHEPFGHMRLEQRALRNALRAHGRQLGDARDSKRGTQAVDRLAHEVAFEHWHRMLFARFLAENGLLIHPDHGVAVSIEDCIDLAKEQGQDPWALAASFAQNMLPQIFRKDDPVLSVALPTNRRTQIEKLLADLPAEDLLCDRRTRLDLPVLAEGAEGRGQRCRQQDRRGRTAGGHAVVHRGLHGGLPAR